jgi:hypothetical protein
MARGGPVGIGRKKTDQRDTGDGEREREKKIGFFLFFFIWDDT